MSFHFAFILPTTKCEAHCEHCFYEVGHARRVEEVDYLYPLDEALDRLADQGLQQVIISGGEPLDSPRLGELTELCASKVMHLLLLTHGRKLDEGRLADLERWGVDDISIAAHRVTGDLSRTINTVLFHSPYVPTLLSCLTRRNLDQIPGLRELADRFNLPIIFTPAYIPKEAAGYAELSLHTMEPAERQELFARLDEWAGDNDAAPYAELLKGIYLGRRNHPGSCAMGRQGLVIDADGSVYPCFHRRDLCAGNLIVHPWETIEQNLKAMGDQLSAAPCYGEHCLSMFVGAR